MTAFFPTLVIGIGGTGKSVLLDIRQRLSSRFGSYKDLKTIGFLALDTDDALDDESIAKDPLSEALAFSASEHLHLTISDTKMSDIRDNLQSHHPALAKWLDKESLVHPSVVAGAGQIRQVGRLALLANIEKVLPAVNDAVTSITSASARKHTLDYLRSAGVEGAEIREKPLRIFTVGSLIGGTGSGMFIDMGYLLREDTVRVMMAGQRPISTGIFAVPLAGRSRSGVDTRASAYAALRELNHYSDTSTTYQVEYPDGRIFESHEPPYDFSFLVSTQSGRSTLDGPRSVVSMIGRRIVLEATSEFSQKIQSNRDNIRKHLAQTDERGCNQHFFTFGLSSIEVPLRRFSTACGARFLVDTLAELKLGKHVEKPEGFHLDPSYLQDFLKDQKLDESGLKKRLLAAAEGRNSLVEGFTSQLDELNQLSGRPVLDRIRKLEAEVQSALRRSQGEGGKSGAATEQIRANAEKLRERALPILVELVETQIRDPKKRLITAKSVVNSLHDTFSKLRDKLSSRNDELSGRLRKGQAALKRHNKELEDIVSDPFLRYSFWGGTAFKEAFSSRYARDAKRLWEMLFEEAILSDDCLITVVDTMLSKLAELKDRVSNYELFLDKFASDFQSLVSQASKSVIPINGLWVNSLTGREEEHDDPVDAAYDAILGDKKRELMNRFLEKDILEYLKSTTDESHSGETGLFGMERRGVALETLTQDLWTLSTKLMSQHGHLEDTDVVRAFLQNKDAAETFQQVSRLSAPFLEIDRSDSKFDDHAGKEQILVGFADAVGSGSSSQQKFQELCDTYIDGVKGHHDERLVPLDNKYQVIFYREYGAFPIRLWTHLKALQQAYERQIEKSRLPLHLGGHAETYLPIVKAAKEDIDRLSTTYLIGSMPGIGVLKKDGEKDGTRLDFTESGMRRVLQFSGNLDAIAGRLYDTQIEGVPEYIQAQIAKKRSSLGDQAFAALILNYRNDLYDSDLSEQERERHLTLIDAYLDSDRGLKEARDSSTGQASPLPTEPTSSASDVEPKAESSSSLSIPEQIKALGELKDSGLLTDDEFQSKKQELLDRL